MSEDCDDGSLIGDHQRSLEVWPTVAVRRDEVNVQAGAAGIQTPIYHISYITGHPQSRAARGHGQSFKARAVQSSASHTQLSTRGSSSSSSPKWFRLFSTPSSMDVLSLEATRAMG